MPSEQTEAHVIEQLQAFANTLERVTGEAVRPDVEPVLLAPTRSRHRRLVPTLAAAATISVVAGGLLLLSPTTGPEPQPPALTATPEPEPTAPPTSTTPTTQAAPTTTIEPVPVWTDGLLSDLETDSLRPLDTADDGGFVVPTAPADWRILAGSYDTSRPDLHFSRITIIEARPDGTTGPWIELDVSRVGICTSSGPASCETAEDSTDINGVTWQPFTEIVGARATVGDLFVDVQISGRQFDGPFLADPLVIEYLEGLRVGTGNGYWFTISADVGETCWDCLDPDQTE